MINRKKSISLRHSHFYAELSLLVYPEMNKELMFGALLILIIHRSKLRGSENGQE